MFNKHLQKTNHDAPSESRTQDFPLTKRML